MTEKRKKFNGEKYHPSEEELFEANESRQVFEQRVEKLLTGKGEPPLETTELALGIATRLIKEMDRTCLKFKDLVLESYLAKAEQARQSENLEEFYELIKHALEALHEFQFLYSQHPGSWNIYNRQIIDLLSSVSQPDADKIIDVYQDYIRELGWYVKDADCGNMKEYYAKACGEYALFLTLHKPESKNESRAFADLSNRYGYNPYGGADSLLTCAVLAEASIALQANDLLEAAKKIEIGFYRFAHLSSDKRPLWLAPTLKAFANRYVEAISTFVTREQIAALNLKSLDSVSSREDAEFAELVHSMVSTRVAVVERICGVSSSEFFDAVRALAEFDASRGHFKSAFRNLRRTRARRVVSTGTEWVTDRLFVSLTYARLLDKAGYAGRADWIWDYLNSPLVPPPDKTEQE